jgi:hypothetical protein
VSSASGSGSGSGSGVDSGSGSASSGLDLYPCNAHPCLHVVRSDVYDEEGYNIDQEFDIMGGISDGSPDCLWRRAGGDDDLLNHDYPDRWAYSFFGGATEGIRYGDSPIGTYVYSTDLSTHTVVITYCENSSTP